MFSSGGTGLFEPFIQTPSGFIIWSRSFFKVDTGLLSRSFSWSSSISVPTRSISFLPARWSSLPFNTIVIMFILEAFSLFTFTVHSFQDFMFIMFIISSRVGWRTFGGSFCSFSSINSVSCLQYNALYNLMYNIMPVV